MQDELQKRLISSLDKVQEYIEATEGFVVEQAPLVAQEIIAYGKVCSVWAMLCLILVALIFCIASIIYRKAYLKEDGRGEKDAYLMCTVVCSVGCCFISVLTFCLVPLAMKPWIMPRLYLIQEISKLL